MTPCSTLRAVVNMNIGTIIAQTTMQYRHRALISYRAWDQSQVMKTIASVTPTCSPTQYQRAKRAPASSAMPIVMTMPKPTMPRNGFGKPSSAAWADFMTVPQETHGLMSQLVT